MQKIQISTKINSTIGKVREYFNNPKYIVNWNSADESWHSPKAENDLKVGGKFNYRMEAKDGSFGFDFTGTYTEVVENEKIKYIMDDNREVVIFFEEKNGIVEIKTIFDAESENDPEFQKSGWQAILDNFKKYVENN